MFLINTLIRLSSRLNLTALIKSLLELVPSKVLTIVTSSVWERPVTFDIAVCDVFTMKRSLVFIWTQGCDVDMAADDGVFRPSINIQLPDLSSQLTVVTAYFYIAGYRKSGSSDKLSTHDLYRQVRAECNGVVFFSRFHWSIAKKWDDHDKNFEIKCIQMFAFMIRPMSTNSASVFVDCVIQMRRSNCFRLLLCIKLSIFRNLLISTHASSGGDKVTTYSFSLSFLRLQALSPHR